MSSSAQFLGGARVTSLPGSLQSWVTGGGLSVIGPCVATASGSMSAGAWKTLVQVTGSGGALRLLMARTTNATSKTLSYRITRDGVEIFNSQSPSIAQTSAGLAVYGGVYGSTNFAVGDGPELIFDNSLLVEVKSSVTETDGFNFYSNYDLRG